MRNCCLTLVALIFTFHIATATINVDKIKELKSTAGAAVEKLHTVKQTAASSLLELSQKVSNGLKELKERASYNLQHLTDDIDLKNLHKLDILQIGPTLKGKYELIKDLYKKPETKVNVIHIYGDELNSHFDHAKLVKVKKWHPAIPHHHHHVIPVYHDPHHHQHLEHYHVPWPLIRSDD